MKIGHPNQALDNQADPTDLPAAPASVAEPPFAGNAKGESKGAKAAPAAKRGSRPAAPPVYSVAVAYHKISQEIAKQVEEYVAIQTQSTAFPNNPKVSKSFKSKLPKHPKSFQNNPIICSPRQISVLPSLTYLLHAEVSYNEEGSFFGYNASPEVFRSISCFSNQLLGVAWNCHRLWGRAVWLCIAMPGRSVVFFMLRLGDSWE